MASVTGITAEKALEIQNGSVVSVKIVGSDLYFVRGDGTEYNAGRVIQPLAAWPIGSIFIHYTSTNPTTLLGGGTWVRFAHGHALVGLSESIADFNAPGKMSGFLTHTLSIAEMPAHNHNGGTGNQSNFHTHGGETLSAGIHTHGYELPTEPRGYAAPSGSGIMAWDATRTNYATASGGAHTHSFATGGESTNHNHSIASQGLGQPHNIVQPSIAVYMWRRTG